MSQAQKTPLATSLNNFAQKKIEDYLQTQGQILPCSVVAVNGSIVTVNFEVSSPNLTIPQITVPIAESQYTRLPIQVGDTGICIAADTRLGGITGLGTGKAPLGQPSNLGGLVFLPISNKNWFSVNGQYLVLYGPSGVEITTIHQDCKLTLNSSGITIDLNGGNLIVNNGNTTMNGNLTVNGLITGTQGFHITGGTGGTMNITGDINQTGNFANTGNLTNNGKNVGSTHEHSGVQTGSSNTGAPI
jgi:hypothetical protein